MSDLGVPTNSGPSDEALGDIAQGDGWWGKWRGVQAWELTFETPIVVACALYRLMSGDVFIIDALVKLTPLITVYLGARYAVLGVHVWQGSHERQIAMTTKSSRAD